MLDYDDTAGLRADAARAWSDDAARPSAPDGHGDDVRDRTWSSAGTVAAVVAIGAGVILRFVAPAGLWLDEAQAVVIAHLPLGDIPGALRQDGAPPLYYVVLHGWMRLFGTGDVAVRALSVLLGLVAIPLAWFAGRTVGSRHVALAATLIVATSPFAIRYSTETRMYSAVVALVLAGIVLVDRELRGATSSAARSVGIAVLSGALLLTHYWAAFLLLAAVLVVGRRARRDRRARRAALAIAAGSLSLVPWLPSLSTQLRRTGAPWGRPPGPEVAELVAEGFGGTRPWGSLLAVVLLLACGIVVGRATYREDGSVAAPAIRDGRGGVPLLVVGALTLLFGAVALQISGEGFAPRHAAVAFPPLAVGLASAADVVRPNPRAVLLALVATLGLVAATGSARTPRTQAEPIAARLAASAAPGDVVVLCPDQLGPAIHRVLPDLAGASPLLVPSGSRVERVDWTDYRNRVRRVRANAVADRIHAAAGPGTVWFVTSPVYTDIGDRCISIRQALARLRPEMRSVVTRRPAVFENAGLWRAPSPQQENP